MGAYRDRRRAAVAPITTISPADVTIATAASFIETAGFDLAAGIFVVKATWSFDVAKEVSAAHGGIYDSAHDDTLVEFPAYYNSGAMSGSPTPDAKMLLLPAAVSGVTFYAQWPGESTTGSLTDVEIDLYRLAAL